MHRQGLFRAATGRQLLQESAYLSCREGFMPSCAEATFHMQYTPLSTVGGLSACVCHADSLLGLGASRFRMIWTFLAAAEVNFTYLSKQ